MTDTQRMIAATIVFMLIILWLRYVSPWAWS